MGSRVEGSGSRGDYRHPRVIKFPRWVPMWLILGWLRIAAQVRCARCLVCPWCEEINQLEAS